MKGKTMGHVKWITRPEYVVWTDPGLMNGYAWYSLKDDTMVLEEYLGPKHISMIEAAVTNPMTARRTTIGCENFIITSETSKKSQDAKRHIEMMGMIRRAVEEEYSGIKIFEFNVKQTSSDVKTFCPDRILRELGWWRLGFDHCHDAARHVFYYLAENRWLNDKQQEALVPAA
jgi:hypothetical protein